MIKALYRFITATLLFAAALCFAQQLQRQLDTAKGSTQNIPVPHPLEWWTQNPLRLDADGVLMIGFKAHDGKPITAQDYKVEQQITTLGTLSGHKIVQIMMTIHPGNRVVNTGFALQGPPYPQWKSLLVEMVAGDRYVEIFGEQYDQGGLMNLKSAAIYGSGPKAILATDDSDLSLPQIRDPIPKQSQAKSPTSKRHFLPLKITRSPRSHPRHQRHAQRQP